MANCCLFIKYIEDEWSTRVFICNNTNFICNTNVLYPSQVTSAEHKRISYQLNGMIYNVSWLAKSTISANS